MDPKSEKERDGEGVLTERKGVGEDKRKESWSKHRIQGAEVTVKSEHRILGAEVTVKSEHEILVKKSSHTVL